MRIIVMIELLLYYFYCSTVVQSTSKLCQGKMPLYFVTRKLQLTFVKLYILGRFFPRTALEDALKIRQLLGEFDFQNGGNRARIVGFREFVFTHDVSSIANFFSLQVRDRHGE